MNQSGIETFLAIVRLGNVTEAARYLFLSQSTVSHRLALLEKEIGTELIERKKGVGNVSLTSAGERLLKIAERWEEMMREIQGIKTEGSKSTFSIGAVDSVNAHVLGPVYRELRRYSSVINVRVRTQQSPELYSLIEHKEIDVAFPLFERSLRGIKVEKFFEEPMVLIKKRESAITISKSLSITQFDPNLELYIDWGPQFRIWHQKWLGTEETQGTQVDTGELLLVFMNEPKYWAIVPVSMANNLKETNSITIHTLIEPPPKRTCYRIQRISEKQNFEIFDECLSAVQEDIEKIIRLN